MKIRTSFVSNSSSGSFVLNNWSEIPPEVQELILNPPDCSYEDQWSYNINQQSDSIHFYTYLDNFDQLKWVRQIIEQYEKPKTPFISNISD